jgi:uncharacterized protein (TIGR02596 family)
VAPLSHASRIRSGFSLLELALVLAISAILVGLAGLGYAGVMQSTALTTGADMICDTFAEGRTSAIVQNMEVEVRFYDVPAQPGAAPTYSALQLHWIKANGTCPAVNRVMSLSSWVSMDATGSHSPLIASNAQTPTPDSTDPLLNAQTRVFHFLPDGTTDLNPTTNWFVTVRPASQSDPANFPSNWSCVKIDPMTGRTQIYRP